MKKLFVIDASGYLYRSYFAIRNMTNSKGESTNALFGFIRSVLKLIKDFEPTHLVSVFDGPHAISSRKRIYPEYKAHRSAMPQDLRYQIEWAKKFCDLMKIPKLVIPEVEADDAMGSVAIWATGQDFKVYLCSGDKDLCQLVNDTIHLLITHKDNLILDPMGVLKTYGVPPEKIVDYLSLVGDSSDNIPGVTGIGPKTACELLQQFVSLDRLLDEYQSVSGAKRQNALKNERNKALLAKKLVTLDLSVTIPEMEGFYQLKTPIFDDLIQFYTQHSFTSLIKEHESEKGKSCNEETNYQLIDDPDQLQDLIQHLEKEKEIAVDTETTHIRPLQASLVGLGLTTKKNHAWYLPFNGKTGLEFLIKTLKPFLESRKVLFYGHNIKYDIHVLKNHGINLNNVSFDTILASYLLNSHNRQHSLDYLVLNSFGKVKTPISDLIGKGKKQITMKEVPIEKVCNYCCEDVDYTLRIKEELEEKIKERHLEPLLFDLELPLMHVLVKMERHGMYLDLSCLKKLGVTVKAELEKIQEEIYQMAGETFNINSPKQIGEILFDKLGINPPKKTQTGFSTNAKVLESLSEKWPICTKILEYRLLEKLRSTYIDTLPEEIHPKTGRIHPTFNQSVTATGRLSCQDPNLQNIPIRSEIGCLIREAFRPEKDNWSYLSADYSQIELRLLAHLSNDPQLIDAFKNNQDIHAQTASAIYNIPLEKVTPDQRQSAKAVNFGIIYGQQAFGLSQILKIPVRDANYFIEAYFQKYPKVRLYLEHCKELARQSGKAVTSTGRERLVPEINSKNMHIRQAAERLVVNTPIQGTCADLIKLSMLKIDKIFSQKNWNGFMILQIHDELIFEMPDEEINEAKKEIKQAMESIYELKVPLIVDISIGKNWKEC